MKCYKCGSELRYEDRIEDYIVRPYYMDIECPNCGKCWEDLGR